MNLKPISSPTDIELLCLLLFPFLPLSSPFLPPSSTFDVNFTADLPQKIFLQLGVL